MIDEELYEENTLGGRLLAARDAARMSLSKLAETLGVTSQTVRNWECDRSEPSVERMVYIAKVMNVQPLWLISGEIDAKQASALRKRSCCSPTLTAQQVLSQTE